MLKQLAIVLMVISLVACGGGGETAAGGTGTGTGTGGTVTPNPGGSNGSNSQAETISPVLADLMTPLLFAVPELNEADSVYLQHYQLGGLPCVAVPFNDLLLNQTRNRAVTLSNCQFNTMQLNGNINYVDSFASSKTGYDINYQNVELSNGPQKFIISGSSRIAIVLDTSSSVCEAKTIVTHNLRFTSATATVQLNNLVLELDGGRPTFCANPGVRVSGTINHSATGNYNLSTEIPLAIYRNNMMQGLDGAVVLQAAKQSMRFELDLTETALNTNLVIRDQNQQPVFNFTVPLAHATALAFSDFNDTDGDGMLNGYERALGFDPADAADAKADKDADGFSNLEEFKFGGDPLKILAKPLAVQLGFYDIERAERQGMQSSFTVSVPTMLIFGQQVPAQISIKADLSGDFQFKQQSSCLLSNGNKTILCKLRREQSGNLLTSFQVETDSYNYNEIKGSIRVELSSSLPDLTPDDNIFSGEIVRFARLFTPMFRHRISYGDNLSTDRRAFSLVKEQPTQLYINAAFQNNVPEHGFIQPVLPAGMEIQKLECLVGSGATRWESCSQMAFKSAQEFRMTLLGRQTGFFELPLQVYRDEKTSTPFASYTMMVTVGESTAALQQRIDAAANGAEVLVPAGIYVGALNLTNKTTQLKASGTAYLTNLLPTDLYIPYPPTISMTLGQQSSIEGFVLANHKIKINNTGGNLIGNQLGASRYGLLQNVIEAEGDLRFQANQINFADDGRWYDFYYAAMCPRLTFHGAAADVVIANNVIQGPQSCDGLFQLKSSLNLTFVHNTFIDAGHLFKIDGSALPTPVFNAVLDNNILANSYFSLTELNWYSFDVPGNTISANNNIVWGMAEEFYGFTYPAINVTNIINADPRLDANAKPGAGSAAIDRAIESARYPAAVQLPVAVDGDGNGVAVRDIGAVEYQN